MTDLVDSVRTSIAIEIALLVREAPTPIEPFGYGRDLSCVSDFTPSFAEIDPSSTEGISQSVLRRWTCPRGGNCDDADYGKDIRGYLNRPTTQQDLLELDGALSAEALQDDRVAGILLDVKTSNAGQIVLISARIEPADPNVNTFFATFGVVNGALTLEAFQ